MQKTGFTPTIILLIVAGILVVGGLAMTLNPGSYGQPMAALFERKSTTFTDTFDVGPAGGAFRVPVRGVPNDSMNVRIPANAVEKPISVSLGYSTGSLKLNAGIPSGIVLVLKTTPVVTFSREVTIGVFFPPNTKHKGVVGYEIDPQGRLRPLDLIDLDMKDGRVSFLTFKPLTLTWVYID